jgi:hypothetical protein
MVCDKCEEAYITGNSEHLASIISLEERITWYERAMKQILICCELRDNYGVIEDIAQTSLDGEPTTADEYNNKEKPKVSSIISSIGYRGED